MFMATCIQTYIIELIKRSDKINSIWGKQYQIWDINIKSDKINSIWGKQYQIIHWMWEPAECVKRTMKKVLLQIFVDYQFRIFGYTKEQLQFRILIQNWAENIHRIRKIYLQYCKTKRYKDHLGVNYNVQDILLGQQNIFVKIVDYIN